ncbi:MAG: hypothetical protein JRJ49_04020 [Deltaproteobacteria bacterium]|nr:hypothetical protein [Deltaproteobacteria bacterium]
MYSEKSEKNGLVFVRDKIEDYNRITKDYNEIIALEHAEKYKADAVYFKRFNDGKPSIPLIYLYDFTLIEKQNNELANLHKKLWNASKVPLFFIFSNSDVKIFSCLKQPIDKKTGEPALNFIEQIKLASNIKKEVEKIKNFLAEKFDNGSFWNNPEYKNSFDLKKSAYLTLLQQLKLTRKKIIAKKILSEKVVKKLLVMSILVKYLEERKGEKGNTVFPEGFFSAFTGSKNKDDFAEVLKTKGACLKLFDELSGKKRFNGEIFSWKDKKEREELKNADLTVFVKQFFDGKMSGRQYTFWKLYSFNDLPIELISNIYEDFLGKKEGVVYTPPYLVNLLIDEVMPIADFEKRILKLLTLHAVPASFW